MALQMIFCVETNKKADTDSIYISETLKSIYEIDNKVKINKVYLEKNQNIMRRMFQEKLKVK